MKPRVLMLPKWYPNRYDDQDGDFVARHVAAIAPHADVAVVFATVASGPLTAWIEREEELNAAVPVLRYYYRARPSGLPILDKLLKLLLYYWCVGQGYNQVVQRWGANPDLVHVHVLLRTGLTALWWRWRYGIPYIITEHWTLYLPFRAHSIGWLRQQLTRVVVRRAAALHTVSKALQQAMRNLGFRNDASVVIANVVDTALFCPPDAPRAPHTLLHVAAFHEDVKNLTGILRVVAGLRSTWPTLRLRLAGYGPDEVRVRRTAQELGLLTNGTVTFLGKLSHAAVAAEMRRATALVSFSRAETFGCVLLEARACACPVVATRTGGVPELFQPSGRFGLLVAPDDETALASALVAVLSGSATYEPDLLRYDAELRCSPARIGSQFAALYASILRPAGGQNSVQLTTPSALVSC
ncbi:glycosyltransferase [Hymenobacter sp. HDW8]|uniref:glycosyltransferase n=1 Tax=Hymenobacter sp. HDW8 TaxID=2714932 RepID=UPI00140C03BD|nr:glycosyltransferase [Hymenobacter sp. HDW8]QIL76075.1 glycosyltransferase family 4 protein [Hymenobacter sp. HDW8]